MAIRKRYIITNYRIAWINFKKTSEYNDISGILADRGIKQPYRDNILEASFAAGWRATGKKIFMRKIY
jgi:hypothetical protein